MLSPVSPLSASSDPAALARFARNSSASGQPTPAEVKKAAAQFEAIMVRQLLKPAIEPMMNGGALGSVSSGGGGGQGGGGAYSYLLTDTLASSITQGGGFGLASVITRQLSPASSAASLADVSE